MSYTYDNDSRVTGITYKFNANTLGNLTYSYDSLGRRTQVGGSFAQTGLPGAISSATYDAANELTNWNGTSISYDSNGNILSDGANAFTWNARNEVATLNGRNLQYDAAGRRIQNQLGTSFLYDGANAAQELSGSTVTANLLSGRTDEFFSRIDSSGSSALLKDVLGSTIALADGSGNLTAQYSYDPFGNTTVSGATNANEFQYTGRENEGNGLYYNRGRYVETIYGRFISEDPLGFGGGDANLYAYVGDSPTNFIDPFGLSRDCFTTACGGLPGVTPQTLAGRKDDAKWWSDFWTAFFTQPYRKPKERFVDCWNRAAGDTLGAAGLPSDYQMGTEALAGAAGAVGLFSSVKTLWVSGFGGPGWVRASSYAARALGGSAAVVQAARLGGKGLAVLGAAEVGLRGGAGLDCAIPNNY
jgi:RHS repeat-associated protein